MLFYSDISLPFYFRFVPSFPSTKMRIGLIKSLIFPKKLYARLKRVSGSNGFWSKFIMKTLCQVSGLSRGEAILNRGFNENFYRKWFKTQSCPRIFKLLFRQTRKQFRAADINLFHSIELRANNGASVFHKLFLRILRAIGSVHDELWRKAIQSIFQLSSAYNLPVNYSPAPQLYWIATYIRRAPLSLLVNKLFDKNQDFVLEIMLFVCVFRLSKSHGKKF